MKKKLLFGTVFWVFFGLVIWNLPLFADAGQEHSKSEKEHEAHLGNHSDGHQGVEHLRDMENFQRVMSGNFAALMAIVSGMIYNLTESVKEGATVLIQHADEIAGLRPAINTDKVDEYNYFASSLKIHAKHILEEMSHQDMIYSHHLGEIIDTCLSCHNIFRPHVN